jgi:hypothetical protein
LAPRFLINIDLKATPWENNANYIISEELLSMGQGGEGDGKNARGEGDKRKVDLTKGLLLCII